MDPRTDISDMPSISLIRGTPLSEEPGMGALTFPGYLREVTQRYAASEAVVMHGPGGVLRWSYQDLWDRSVEIARALIATGVTKGTRVGMLMTNRAEYLAALFGTAMAGGVPVVLSTFSTPSELDYLLGVSGISILFYEDRVLKKDFTAILTELEPAVLNAAAGEITSTKYPFLKRLVYLSGVTAQQPHKLNPTNLTTTKN